ncbi:unnamed protein product, partial [Amoebophrya sp. A25]|eukprot:GSA25T00027207001.1
MLRHWGRALRKRDHKNIMFLRFIRTGRAVHFVGVPLCSICSPLYGRSIIVPLLIFQHFLVQLVSAGDVFTNVSRCAWQAGSIQEACHTSARSLDDVLKEHFFPVPDISCGAKGKTSLELKLRTLEDTVSKSANWWYAFAESEEEEQLLVGEVFDDYFHLEDAPAASATTPAPGSLFSHVPFPRSSFPLFRKLLEKSGMWSAYL